jgi:Leucine-rich repeat (LRR) protein
MKNYMCFVLAFCMLLSLTACGRSGATQSTSDQSTLHSASDVVTFSDPTLEAMVRGSMGKPKGNITMAEAETVTRLNLSVDWCQQYISQGSLIKNIGGLESFTNLENLDLSSQAVSDITPLSGLTKLTTLSLNGNPIADIAPLAKLTNLKWLKLTGCVANDYSPLSELVNLNLLILDKSTISDVSPLVALTNLKYLFLADSQIKNYMPLMEIYPNLEQSDFDASRTLAALGFTFNDVTKWHYIKRTNMTYASIVPSGALHHSQIGKTVFE